MGFWQSQEMRDRLPFDQGLHWHLFVNHYPSLPRKAFEIAKQAIEKANRGEWDARIDCNPDRLPFDQAPIAHRTWGTQIPVNVIISGWHLEPWVDFEED